MAVPSAFFNAVKLPHVDVVVYMLHIVTKKCWWAWLAAHDMKMLCTAFHWNTNAQFRFSLAVQHSCWPFDQHETGCHVYFGKFTQVHISISHKVKPCCWGSMHDVKYVLKSCLPYCMWYNHWLLWNNVNSTTGWQVVPGVCWLSLGEIDCKEGAAPKKPFHICLQILPNYQPNEKWRRFSFRIKVVP